MTPPMVTCPPNIMRTLDSQIPGEVVVWQDATATDNSGTATLVSTNPQSGTFFTNPSTTTVEYTYADPSGNTAGCMFLVIIDRGKLRFQSQRVTHGKA